MLLFWIIFLFGTDFAYLCTPLHPCAANSESVHSHAQQLDEDQKEVKWILDNYGNKLKWTKDETAIDLGSLNGEITLNVLYPYIKSHIKSITGVDREKSMVEYANEHNKNEKIKYQILNKNDVQPADKLFSFYTLHKEPEPKKVATNVHNFLKPGGEAFLLVVADHELYRIWDEVAKRPKWKKYLPNIPEHANELPYTPDPLKNFTSTLESAGLNIKFAELTVRKDVFHPTSASQEDLIERICSTDPYVALIPENLRKDYLKDVVESMKKIRPFSKLYDYKAIIVVASRPS